MVSSESLETLPADYFLWGLYQRGGGAMTGVPISDKSDTRLEYPKGCSLFSSKGTPQKGPRRGPICRSPHSRALARWMGVNKATKIHDPLRVGQPILENKMGVRPARGRMICIWPRDPPQSFGANAPPTWGQSMITTKFIWLKSVISTYARFAS